MTDDKIKCLLVEPNKLPKEIEIKKELEEYQRLVGGWIEEVYLPFDDDIVIICNEEGKINGMELNRDIGRDIIAGPFLIVGDDYDNADFKSLTQEQVDKYKLFFNENSIKRTNARVNAILMSNANRKFMKERER